MTELHYLETAASRLATIKQKLQTHDLDPQTRRQLIGKQALWLCILNQSWSSYMEKARNHARVNAVA